ncbi:helix-turn-helix domain-containing protein [Eubacterium maltosivorans]|uniref:XRE family transcriptional regulator n=1 Tax=Eubacterium maltosivorans TaxID=2041044 RepID=A0A4P9C4H0_EUBML|nr:helix-turn-helix transcriptional regulator [Eubacterium maltosivorans]QCT70134.1 XRE family transcriptional regulator [Eubacterium maltosivorans]
MKEKVVLGERIRTLRESNNMSQVQLARELGISKASVHQWESCISIPSLVYLIEMARLFNVSLDFIAGTTSDEMINIGNLKQTQKEVVYSLVNCFKADNKE